MDDIDRPLYPRRRTPHSPQQVIIPSQVPWEQELEKQPAQVPEPHDDLFTIIWTPDPDRLLN